MRKKYNKVTALAVTFSLAIGTLFTGLSFDTSSAQAAANEVTYPWTPASASLTGDYIADSYDDIEAGHVIESVTQERLLDILSSKGTYYIVFGGPEHETSQIVLGAINDQAKADGIKKIYHFDPFIDGYQIDITDEDTEFVGNKTSVNELWNRVLELLPESDLISSYDSSDTLLFAIEADGKGANQIKDSYSLTESDVASFDKLAAKQEIAAVFRGGLKSGTVVQGDIRTDFEFFKRVYNGSATYIETRNNDTPTEDRLGKAVEIFTDEDEKDFALHQVNFNELINLLNSEGEYYIFFGASWCHNTQAIIGSVERKAKANGKKVYVYDTTVGNQLTFGTGADIDKVVAATSGFNSRNNAFTTNRDTGELEVYTNISYLYGELVKYLGDFTTENNSKRNNSISYFPNGDLTDTVTSVAPWEDADGDTVKNAIRLQMPFLIAYDKDAQQPVTKQWLHKNAANDGTYTEYMLELAWVLATEEAKADTDKSYDGLTKVEFATESVAALSDVLGEKNPAENSSSSGNTPTQAPPTADPTVSPTPTAPAAVEAPAKAKAGKISAKKKSSNKLTLTLKKVSGASGYEVQISKAKKFTKKNILVKKTSKNLAVTVTSKKLKNKAKLFVRIRAYTLDGSKKLYGKWSAVKQVKIKK